MRFRPKLTLASFSVLLLAIAGLIRVPYVLLTPGPAYSTIGEIDGQKFISISGVTTYPTQGELFMTTVSEYGGPSEGIDIFQAIWGWLNPDQELAPREAFYDESVDEELNHQQNVEAFSSSQTYAVGAALKYLDLPVQEYVVVSSITAGAPAVDLLRAGDKIISVNQVQTKTSKEVAQLVRSNPIGSQITFLVDRSGSKLEIKVTSAARVDDPTTAEDESGIAYVGIGLDMQYVGQFNVDFAETNIGGPSAGMMFSIAIVDLLTPGALTQGESIAGTGTVDGNGNVGPIGGISRKLIGARDAGATLFIAPKSNCSEIINIPEGLTVVAVETLDQAIKAIDDFNSGAPLVGCESIN